MYVFEQFQCVTLCGCCLAKTSSTAQLEYLLIVSGICLGSSYIHSHITPLGKYKLRYLGFRRLPMVMLCFEYKLCCSEPNKCKSQDRRNI